MFVINDNNSNSKLTKVVSIISTIAVVIGLFVQVIGLLSFTKTWIGKRIRKGLIGTMYDYMDESIDQAASRMPAWLKKIESISGSIEQ